jgi:predicted RNase H-like nuclease (RuvC/YqgF family)
LARGETAFRERMSDLKLLDYKRGDLKRELKIHMRESNKISVYKNEIYSYQNELIEEKLKVKALSEELENPLNVHRCRNLEGTDPDIYEMQEKIKTLQKRLIFKTEQVVEKEVLAHQK